MKRTTQKMYAVLLTFVMLCGCLIIPTPATVEAAGNTKLKVTSAKTVVVGKTIKIKTNVKAKFKSSNKKIATVSSKGVVKGKKAGKVKITVTSKSNKKQKKVIKITVKKKQNTTATTEKQTPAPNPKPTTEQPSVVKPTTETPTTEAPTTEKPTTEAPTTEKPTTEAPTTEKPTTEAPTTEEPKMVGITAKYRGEKVPKGSRIVEYGIDITEIYSDGGTKNVDYYGYDIPDVSDNFTEETTQDGKVYHIYTVSYLGFTTSLKVEVVDVGETLYPIQMIANYNGEPKKSGEFPNVDDVSTSVTLSDTKTFVEAEKSKLDFKFFSLTENGDGDFYVVYNYTFEYNGEELYVCVRRSMVVPYE